MFGTLAVCYHHQNLHNQHNYLITVQKRYLWPNGYHSINHRNSKIPKILKISIAQKKKNRSQSQKSKPFTLRNWYSPSLLLESHFSESHLGPFARFYLPEPTCMNFHLPEIPFTHLPKAREQKRKKTNIWPWNVFILSGKWVFVQMGI